MKTNKFGQLVYSENDVCDLLMQGHDMNKFNGMIVDDSVRANHMPDLISPMIQFGQPESPDSDVARFHQQQQSHWHMPDQYRDMDIATHVLDLCRTEAELQRCGAELLLFQERNLFDLLKYLKYMVDVMSANQVVWGVGRGSSVASYVLYKLGVHRIDSLYYNLDISEFLR